MLDQYDNYGILKSIPWPDIKKGDLVSYSEPKRIKVEGKSKPVKMILKYVGIWDGEKVQFDDKDKTLIRTTRWLTKEN